MSVVPRTLVEKLQFFESRVGPWLEHAAQIGTTDADVEALHAWHYPAGGWGPPSAVALT